MIVSKSSIEYVNIVKQAVVDIAGRLEHATNHEQVSAIVAQLGPQKQSLQKARAYFVDHGYHPSAQHKIDKISHLLEKADSDVLGKLRILNQ